MIITTKKSLENSANDFECLYTHRPPAASISALFELLATSMCIPPLKNTWCLLGIGWITIELFETPAEAAREIASLIWSRKSLTGVASIDEFLSNRKWGTLTSSTIWHTMCQRSLFTSIIHIHESRRTSTSSTRAFDTPLFNNAVRRDATGSFISPKISSTSVRADSSTWSRNNCRTN